MARMPFPSIHGIESLSAFVKGPFSDVTCVEVLLNGEDDETIRVDFWFLNQNTARRFADAVNAVSLKPDDAEH